MQVLMLNSVFPVLSETFLYHQYQQLNQELLNFTIVSSNKPCTKQVHPNMRAIQAKVHYLSSSSLKQMISAHWAFLCKAPLKYISVLGSLLFMEEKLIKSLSQLTGALLILNKYQNIGWVHSHFTYGATAIAYWLKKLNGIPYSITLHGADLLFDNPPDLSEKMLNAAEIISISQYNLTYLQQNFPEIELTKCHVLPLGIQRIAEKNVNIGQITNNVQILSVGRLSVHKGQHLLIAACAQLKAKNINFHCNIIGDGPLKKDLSVQIKQLGLNNQVSLLGAQFHDQVMAAYNKADVFVSSSITEGMPLVLMEAMQAGVPVIAPALAGIPELLDYGKAGLLYDPDGNVPNEICKNINELIINPRALLLLKSRAVEQIKTKFDLPTNVNKFNFLLQNFIEKHSGE